MDGYLFHESRGMVLVLKQPAMTPTHSLDLNANLVQYQITVPVSKWVPSRRPAWILRDTSQASVRTARAFAVALVLTISIVLSP